MILNDALTLIATQLKADPQALIAFAAEDTIGGYDVDESNRKFPQGSLWEPEGKILYALVRWLKPKVVAEIGGWVGCSASHLAMAVKANGQGHVFSVDSGVGGMTAGERLLPELREYVTFVREDGRTWLTTQAPESIGLLFEDADHSTQLVKEIAQLALPKLEIGGVMVNHDAAHDFAILGNGQRVHTTVGREVREGLEQAGVWFRPYLVEPSDCGLAITVKPGVKTAQFEGIANIRESRAPELPALNVLPQFEDTSGLISEVPAVIGNANIESLSEPPPLKPKSRTSKK
jgi:predicted O-methyltransferase YrrM